MTKHCLTSICLALAAVLAYPAWADCYADYKAKRGKPLQLHYGIVRIPEEHCGEKGLSDHVAERIHADGWELLSVVSVFGAGELEERQDSAGDYYLRY